jgi:carbon-monoxide dehydrogenase medium subunit
MLSGSLTYHRPKTVLEACELGRTFCNDGRFLAGGTELLVDFKIRRDAASYLVSLQDITELKAIRSQDGVLRIGSMATMTEIAGSPIVQQVFPVLAEAAAAMGNAQIRNRATIGGNFCRAVPCADTPPICVAGDARVRLVSAERERVVAAAAFFTGPRQTMLHPGELLVEIQIPTQPAGCGASYQRFSLRRGSAVAVSSVAALVVLAGGVIQDARVVLGAVAPIPMLAVRCANALAGQACSPELFARAGQLAAAEAQPITDIRGSEAYRRELVEVLTVRALQEAASRAQPARS